MDEGRQTGARGDLASSRMIRDAVRIFASGFLMGSADVVPGVSGGTIALVLGIYERLVSSIRSASSAIGAAGRGSFIEMKRHLKEVRWSFLLTLLSGILAAVLTLAHLIEVQLEERPVLLAAAFFGLVVGSVFIATRLLQAPKPGHALIAVVIGGALFVTLGFGSGAPAPDPTLWVFLGSGALAICAMILPGISGSLILVLIGMYDRVLSAVNGRDYAAIGVFALGALAGLALFSQLLDRALRSAHDVVLAGLIGLMAGSVRILWPWPDGVNSPVLGEPTGQAWQALVAAVVGAAFVIVVAALARPRTN